jgi:tetratricopeptide (TPR) repeat protein
VSDGYEILSLDEVEAVPYRDSNLIPVRHTLGYRAAGVNAWKANTGGQLVPPHEEDSGNEELYVVVRGRATFTVGDESADAPAGTLIAVPAGVMRTAFAAEDGTIVLAVGGTVGQAFRAGGWDTFAIADAYRRAGRLEEGRATIEKLVADSPDYWATSYNAACWEALAGDADAAFAYLQRAQELDRAEVGPYLLEDGDLDPLRDDPRFGELLG